MLNFEYLDKKDPLYHTITDIPEDGDILTFTEYVCFAINSGLLPNEKTQKLKNIIETLATHNNELVRYTIAKKLCHSVKMPAKIAKILACDKPYIARKILIYSNKLSHLDLLEIVKKSDDQKVIEYIALRTDIGSKLSDAIVNKNSPQAIKILLKNTNSHIEIDAYKIIIGKYQHNKEVMSLLNMRKELSPDLINEILSSADDSLKKLLIDTYKFNCISQKPFSKISILDLKEHKIFVTAEALEIKRRIDILYFKSRLNPFLILRFLCKGDLFSFIYSISKITDIPILNVRSILFIDFQVHKYKDIYLQVGFPNEYIDIVRIMLAVIRKSLLNNELTQNNFAKIVSNKLSNTATNVSAKHAKYISSLIQNK